MLAVRSLRAVFSHNRPRLALRLPTAAKTLHVAAGTPLDAMNGAERPPECPAEPGPDDCCQRGCKVCVWDIYNTKLKAYSDYMQQHHPGVPVPAAKQAKQQQQFMDASMDAFEALERQLQQQAQQRQAQQQQAMQ